MFRKLFKTNSLQKLIKKPALLIVTGLLLAIPIFGNVASAQNIQENLCRGANLEDGSFSSDCTANVEGAEEQVSIIIKKGIDIFSLVVGVVAVVMVMVGGLKYITSQGSSENVTTAKNTILYAVLGLVVVALSQVIVRFVLGQVNGLSG